MFCVTYIDEILITGLSEKEYLQNLEEVLHRNLKRLQNHGICKSKGE